MVRLRQYDGLVKRRLALRGRNQTRDNQVDVMPMASSVVVAQNSTTLAMDSQAKIPLDIIAIPQKIQRSKLQKCSLSKLTKIHFIPPRFTVHFLWGTPPIGWLILRCTQLPVSRRRKNDECGLWFVHLKSPQEFRIENATSSIRQWTSIVRSPVIDLVGDLHIFRPIPH
jgi:hypothetical protein